MQTEYYYRHDPYLTHCKLFGAALRAQRWLPNMWKHKELLEAPENGELINAILITHALPDPMRIDSYKGELNRIVSNYVHENTTVENRLYIVDKNDCHVSSVKAKTCYVTEIPDSKFLRVVAKIKGQQFHQKEIPFIDIQNLSWYQSHNPFFENVLKKFNAPTLKQQSAKQKKLIRNKFNDHFQVVI